MSAHRDNAWAIVTVTILLYVGLYLVLSIQGVYAPYTWGLRGVTHYRWSPSLFTSGTDRAKWNNALIYAFLPLYFADVRLWHTEKASYEERYRVNTALDDKIAEWYRKQEQKRQVPSAPVHTTATTD